MPAHRIVGAVRIGDVALLAGDDQHAVLRAAPAELDGVAELVDIARLAQHAMVELLAARRRPLQQLEGAVDRDAFFVAGDQERDRALRACRRSRRDDRAPPRPCRRSRPSCRRRRGRTARRRRCRRRTARATTRLHRRAAPRRCGRRTSDAARRADAGVEVLDSAVPGSENVIAVHGEAGALEHAFRERQRAAFRRRHRWAAQEIAGDGDGIGGSCSGFIMRPALRRSASHSSSRAGPSGARSRRDQCSSAGRADRGRTGWRRWCRAGKPSSTKAQTPMANATSRARAIVIGIVQVDADAIGRPPRCRARYRTAPDTSRTCCDRAGA